MSRNNSIAAVHASVRTIGKIQRQIGRKPAEIAQRGASGGSRQRTEKINATKQAIDMANQARSEFLAGMGHELRSPLGPIIGFSELLADKTFGDLNPKQEEYVKDILESGRHLLSLINDIIDLAKMDAGQMELELSSFPLATLLDGSLVMVKEKCLKHGISLTTAVPDEVKCLLISADAAKLKQVMFRLLSNAVRFTPEGGAVTLGARLEQCRGSESSHPATSMIEVSIADTGIGIAKGQQANVFDEFHRAAGDARGKLAGTGLGLSLVKRIVEQHGGRVWVESEGTGKGSTFRFTVPVGE